MPLGGFRSLLQRCCTIAEAEDVVPLGLTVLKVDGQGELANELACGGGSEGRVASAVVGRCVFALWPDAGGCSVKDGEQALDAAAERRADAVDAVEVGAAHGAVAHHDEVPGGVFWFAATR